MRYVMAVLGWLVLASGCIQADRLETYQPYESPEAAAGTTISLFATDDAVMSNEEIDRALSAEVIIPEKARIVVLNFGAQPGRYWMSEETAQLDQAALEGLVDKLRKCKRVGSAFVLPSMLAPQKHTVPHMRQAAARCQADLIFLYRFTSQVYQRQRAFAHDQTRANCLVEGVLLDTRTGIIPFAAPVVRSYKAEKTEEDMDMTETIRKAELQAMREALDEIADDLVEFLESE